MEPPFLNSRGQVAIEFMLLIILMMLYIQVVIQPTLEIATGSAEDVVHVGQARLAAEKLYNAAEYAIASSGATKLTVHIFVPEASTVTCNSMQVSFSSTLSDKLSRWPVAVQACDSATGICTKNMAFTVTTAGVSCNETLSGPGFYTLAVSKNSATGGVRVAQA